MKKRILSLILALAIAIIPMSVNAEAEQALYATNIAPDTQVTSLTDVTVTRDGEPAEGVFQTGDIITREDINYIAVVKGDVNGDGKINSTDFMQVRKAYLSLYTLDGANEKAADVNGDGTVNSTDFMQIRRHFLKLYTLSCDGDILYDGVTPVAPTAVTINNPIVDHEALGDFYGDPEINYFEGKYWIYSTTSQADRKQTNMDVLWSEDLSTWTRIEDIIQMEDFPQTTGCIWAPSVIKRGEYYYLSFSINDIQWDSTVAGLMMARSKTPYGPFEKYFEGPLIGRYVYGAQPIDGNFFEDDDGTLYFYYGGHANCNVGIFNDTMDGFIPFEEYLDTDTQKQKDEKTFKSMTKSGNMGHYVEGSYVIKRDGKYYLMWSVGSYVDSTYGVEYGIGDSPLGPFEFQSKILQTDLRIASGPGHHSAMYLEEYDTWIMVYHRRFPDASSGTDRRICIDEMKFDEDGKILPIVMTDSWVLGGENEGNGLVNIARNENASYSASTSAAGHAPEKAFDGIASNACRWSQTGSAPAGQWLQVDFGQSESYNAVYIAFEAIGAGKFIYQKSDDGINWTDITGTEELTTAEKHTVCNEAARYFDTQTSRYFRVYFPEGSAWLSVYELEVYLADGEIIPPPEEPTVEGGYIEAIAFPSASFTKLSGMLEKLHDGIDGSANRWTEHTNPAETCAWVQYDFDSDVKITGVEIKWFQDGAELFAPTDLKIYYLSEGELIEVTPIGDYTFTANAYNTYEFEEITTTSIRIVPTRAEGAKKYVGINEWKVKGEIL